MDYKRSGLGSNSCNPELMEQYRLSEKEIALCYTRSPQEAISGGKSAMKFNIWELRLMMPYRPRFEIVTPLGNPDWGLA